MPDRTAPEGIFATASRLVAGLPGLLTDRLELLALEAERAGRVLAELVLLLVLAALLALTAWSLTWALVVGLLISAGLHWAASLLVALFVNLGVAAWALARMWAVWPRLAFPATRRHLQFTADPGDPPAAVVAPPRAERALINVNSKLAEGRHARAA